MLADGTRRGAGLQALIARGASLSGHERNRTFMLSRAGGALRYVDVSPVTGLDAIADGRAFAWLDFDHDGQRDVVLTNANEPRVQLFRNQSRAANGVLALRLVGGRNTSASEPGGASNRDGIGARVEVVVGGRRRVVELRAGEGLAASAVERLPSGARALLTQGSYAAVGSMAPQRPRPAAIFIGAGAAAAFERTSLGSDARYLSRGRAYGSSYSETRPVSALQYPRRPGASRKGQFLPWTPPRGRM